ncbi:2185_t:CDS:1, partial [Diversispora eburnea]
MKIFGKGQWEFALRVLIFLLLTGVLLYATIHELFIIFKIQRGETLISMSINDLTSTGIPIWNSFICSQNLTRVTMGTIKRGINAGNDNRTIDKTTLLSDSYINKTNTNALTSGEWTLTTGDWP